MRKSFILLLAIAAVSFASCNKSNNDSFESTYSIRFKNGNYESAELQYIVNAYHSAFSSATVNGDEITVNGSSQSDCDTKFGDMVINANKSLSGKTWSDTTTVSGFIAKGDSCIFVVTYEPKNNKDYNTYTSQRDMLLANYDTTPYNCTRTVGHMYLDSATSSSEFTGKWGKCLLSPNINEGTRGEYVYLSAVEPKTGETPVTDIIAVHSTYGIIESEMKLDNRTYTICKGQINTTIRVSFNEGVEDSPKYYLYETHDAFPDNRVLFAHGLYLPYTRHRVDTYYKFFKTEYWWDGAILYDVKGIDKGMVQELNENCIYMSIFYKHTYTGHVLQYYQYDNYTKTLTHKGDCGLNDDTTGVNYYLYYVTYSL